MIRVDPLIRAAVLNGDTQFAVVVQKIDPLRARPPVSERVKSNLFEGLAQINSPVMSQDGEAAFVVSLMDLTVGAYWLDELVVAQPFLH